MSFLIIKNNGVNGAGTCHQKTARTKWFKEMNVAVMEYYFLSRPFDEEGKPIR